MRNPLALADDVERWMDGFSLAGDSFRKIIVCDDMLHRTFDETGVLHVNLLDFLLDETIV